MFVEWTSWSFPGCCLPLQGCRAALSAGWTERQDERRETAAAESCCCWGNHLFFTLGNISIIHLVYLCSFSLLEILVSLFPTPVGLLLGVILFCYLCVIVKHVIVCYPSSGRIPKTQQTCVTYLNMQDNKLETSAFDLFPINWKQVNWKHVKRLRLMETIKVLLLINARINLMIIWYLNARRIELYIIGAQM